MTDTKAWTRDLPTIPGWYWVRTGPGAERIEHLHVGHGSNYHGGELSMPAKVSAWLISDLKRVPLSACDLEYFGPLEAPSDVKSPTPLSLKARKEGEAAFFAGEERYNCPYTHGPEDGSLNGGYDYRVDSWREGYDAAKQFAHSSRPMPSGVNNAISNLEHIFLGCDTVSGSQLSREDMRRLAGDALTALNASAPVASPLSHPLAPEGGVYSASPAASPAKVEPHGKLVGWWNGVMPDSTGRAIQEPSVRWGESGQNAWHDIPLYDGYNPIHYQTPVAPAGMVLVPRKPTEAMRVAVKGWTTVALVSEDDTIEYPVSQDECGEIYRAMLAAAPAAHVAETESVQAKPIGYLNAFDANFLSEKIAGQTTCLIYQKAPNKRAVAIYTAAPAVVVVDEAMERFTDEINGIAGEQYESNRKARATRLIAALAALKGKA